MARAGAGRRRVPPRGSPRSRVGARGAVTDGGKRSNRSRSASTSARRGRSGRPRAAPRDGPAPPGHLEAARPGDAGDAAVPLGPPADDALPRGRAAQIEARTRPLRARSASTSAPRTSATTARRSGSGAAALRSRPSPALRRRPAQGAAEGGARAGRAAGSYSPCCLARPAATWRTTTRSRALGEALHQVAHLAVDAFVEADDPALRRRSRRARARSSPGAAASTPISRPRSAASSPGSARRWIRRWHRDPRGARSDLGAGAELGQERVRRPRARGVPDAWREADGTAISSCSPRRSTRSPPSASARSVDALFREAEASPASGAGRAAGRSSDGSSRRCSARARVSSSSSASARSRCSPRPAPATRRPSTSSRDALGVRRGVRVVLERLLRPPRRALPYLLRKAEGHEAELGSSRARARSSTRRGARAAGGGGHPGPRGRDPPGVPEPAPRGPATGGHLPPRGLGRHRARRAAEALGGPRGGGAGRGSGPSSERGAVAAGPVLVRRIQSAELCALPADERRLLLRTLARLNPRRGEASPSSCSGRPSSSPRSRRGDARDAAELLGETFSGEALAALKNAARKRWWNTAAVRNAAAAGAVAVGARRGALVKEESRATPRTPPAPRTRGPSGAATRPRSS